MTRFIPPIGAAVLLTRARHDAFRAKTGTVMRYIKSRDVVEVRLDNGQLYDASPENIDAFDELSA